MFRFHIIFVKSKGVVPNQWKEAIIRALYNIKRVTNVCAATVDL